MQYPPSSFQGDATGSRECAPDDRLSRRARNPFPHRTYGRMDSGPAPSKSAVADLDKDLDKKTWTNEIAELG